jgi:predicted RNA binding protein YcfA (HicA-like mRNA interferase family)
LNPKKLLRSILRGSRNIRFEAFVGLVQAFGFQLARTDGSHHIFVHPDLPELIDLQEFKGQVKSYQVRQFLKLVERYGLHLENE